MWTSRRQASRRSSSSSDSSESDSESESSEEEDELCWTLDRDDIRVWSLGRDFLGSGAGFDSVFFLATILGSGAFFGGAAALRVGGDFGRDFFSLGLVDLSAFSFEDLSVFDTVEAALVGLDAFDAAALDGVDGVGFATGGAALALNCSNGLGHAPMALGGSSTGGGASFLDLTSALEDFKGVFGSGAGLDVAAALFDAPLLPVATGGGGVVAGIAVSPNSCRARSFTLGNMVYQRRGVLTRAKGARAG